MTSAALLSRKAASIGGERDEFTDKFACFSDYVPAR